MRKYVFTDLKSYHFITEVCDCGTHRVEAVFVDEHTAGEAFVVSFDL